MTNFRWILLVLCAVIGIALLAYKFTNAPQVIEAERFGPSESVETTEQAELSTQKDESANARNNELVPLEEADYANAFDMTVEELAALAANRSNDDLQRIAAKFAGKSNATPVLKKSNALFERAETSSKKLGVFMAEAFYEQRQDSWAAMLAGRGRRSDKAGLQDFDRALQYFNHPSLRDLPVTKIFIGQILSAPDNPNHDLSRAEALFLQAKAAGQSVQWVDNIWPKLREDPRYDG